MVLVVAAEDKSTSRCPVPWSDMHENVQLLTPNLGSTWSLFLMTSASLRAYQGP
jgi:hypothetical protein